MPELPEVETVARQLAGAILGRRLLGARIFDSKLAVEEKDFPSRARVSAVLREGKQVVIQFSRKVGRNGVEHSYLVVHLRMTGCLLWRGKESRTVGRARCHEPSARKPRAELYFDGGVLIFEDVRRFGTFNLHRTRDTFRVKGLDPLTPEFNAQWLEEEIRGSRQAIKAWLLRQDKLVGLGNIYACEALFRAGISPKRKAGALTSDQIKMLCKSVRGILQRAIARSGTTFSDYQTAHGESGGYQRLLQVYDREGLSCRRCHGPIARIVQQQRSTYYCPACQR